MSPLHTQTIVAAPKGTTMHLQRPEVLPPVWAAPHALCLSISFHAHAPHLACQSSVSQVRKGKVERVWESGSASFLSAPPPVCNHHTLPAFVVLVFVHVHVTTLLLTVSNKRWLVTTSHSVLPLRSGGSPVLTSGVGLCRRVCVGLFCNSRLPLFPERCKAFCIPAKFTLYKDGFSYFYGDAKALGLLFVTVY